MRKQIIASALIVVMAAVAFIAMSATRADATRPAVPQPCVETQDHYTDWADDGEAVLTHENTPPGADTDTTRWLPAGSSKHVTKEATEDTEVLDHVQRYSLTGGSFPEGGVVPAFPDPGSPFSWQPNVQGDPHGVGAPGAYSRSNGASGNTDWFYLEYVYETVPGEAEESHTDYLWQPQSRTFVEGEDCPEEPCPGIDYNGADPGCPPPTVGFQHQQRADSVTDCDRDKVTVTREARTGKWIEDGPVFWGPWRVTSTVERDAPERLCPTDEPREPEVPTANEPDAPERTIVHKTAEKADAPALPTSIDAGLTAVPEPAEDKQEWDWFAFLLGALGGVVLGAGLALLTTRSRL
jgi:hypothetical protein